MKFLVVSNTITNGGDFLFLNSGIRLIEEYIGLHNYDYYNIYSTDFQKIDLEAYECMIYVGGPLYINRLIEGILFPIFDHVRELGKRIYVLGSGWYGNSDSTESVYSYKFSEKSRKVLDYIDQNGILGCRDYLSVNILRNNGYKNVIMTGCPVWYEKLKVKSSCNNIIKKIVVSDMGITKEERFNSEKLLQLKQLFTFVQTKFSDSEIIFTFNNGINTKYSAKFNNDVKQFLEEINISYFDLSNGDNEFGVCDNCDLHIGYRVHSHIYSLTRGIPSILICEDARGIGMNQVLGFPVIKANASIDENYENNPYLLKELENEIERLMKHREYEMDRVHSLIQHYYDTNVQEFFDRIKNER